MSDKLVVLIKTSDDLEISCIKQILDENQIPAFIVSTNTDNIFGSNN